MIKIEEFEPDGECFFYVLSNASRVCGAGVIYSTSVLKTLYKKFGSQFYILPSSIHEVILVPVSDSSLDIKGLLNMVKEVNSTVLDPEDKLTDSVYLFDGEDVIKVA